MTRQFDQDDVALFLIITRDYASKGSIIRELGDFLAHPDTKDRGIVLNSVKEAAIDFEENCKHHFKEKDFQPPIFKGLGTLEEIATDLTAIFSRADIQPQPIARHDNNFRDFVFCIMFLLSTFKIKHEMRFFEFIIKYSHSLSLTISYESKNYPKKFIILGVISLENVWTTCPTLFRPTEYKLKEHIARRFEDGFLAAIPFKDDHNKKTLKVKDFERGKIWPLPDYN